MPLAFIQIALGILFLTPVPEFNFDSELFMVATIAPLLLWKVLTFRAHLRRYIKPVMLMALGLLLQLLLVWSIYSLDLADTSIGAAFAVAAILCPTDAVAAITKVRFYLKVL